MLHVEGPWTPEKLEAVSERAQARFVELPAGSQVAAAGLESTEARRLAQDARACAAWMRENALTSAECVGPFDAKRAPKGSRIRIKKGSVVFSSRSDWPREGKRSVRVQVVQVNRTSKGYVDWEGRKGRPVNAEVYWAGSNGYWCWTDINNIEVLAAEAPA